jgi:hypothetical protein
MPIRGLPRKRLASADNEAGATSAVPGKLVARDPGAAAPPLAIEPHQERISDE